ncbi:hypothetical protein D3C76_1216100 [compost metagenome]
MVGAAKAAQGVVGVLVDFGRVAAEPVERRARWLESIVETAERQPFDQGAAPGRPLAPALQAGDQAGSAVQRHGLEIRATENGTLQAGAVVQQVGLGDVTAHAVAKHKQGCAGKMHANMLAEQPQVIDHLAPTVALGVQAQGTRFGATAMATLVMGIQGIASSGQGCAQASIAGGMFGHAMGQQNHGFGWAFGKPLINVKAAMVAGRQPKGIVVHGVSLLVEDSV